MAGRHGLFDSRTGHRRGWCPWVDIHSFFSARRGSRPHEESPAPGGVSDKSSALSNSTEKHRLLRCSPLPYIKYGCGLAPCIRCFSANFPALLICQIHPATPRRGVVAARDDNRAARAVRFPYGSPTRVASLGGVIYLSEARPLPARGISRALTTPRRGVVAARDDNRAARAVRFPYGSPTSWASFYAVQ